MHFTIKKLHLKFINFHVIFFSIIFHKLDTFIILNFLLSLGLACYEAY